MTTVVTDGKVIAVDSQVKGQFVMQGPYQKLWRLDDGSVIGFCGHCTAWRPVVEWLNGGEKPQFKKADFSAIILKPNGDLVYLDEEMHKEPIFAPYAVGTGSQFALGALLHGATPEEAVEIACKLDSDSGGKVISMAPVNHPCEAQ